MVRSDNATLVLPMATRGEIVITEHLSGLLHIPVTTDGFAPYLKYFKILQRCWAHILRDAEAAYVLLEKDDPDRLYYRHMYRKLLTIFRDAKAVATKTADAGGADLHTCAKFEQRVMRIVSAYGTHKFATTLKGAAPNLFTFLRYPGMPPTNNPTERDIRDTSVVQRKIRHQFMNSRGMRVFSMIQSFNSTCRKQGLVPWKCMAKIVDDPDVRHIPGRRRRQEDIPAVEGHQTGNAPPVRGRRGRRHARDGLGRGRRRGACGPRRLQTTMDLRRTASRRPRPAL